MIDYFQIGFICSITICIISFSNFKNFLNKNKFYVDNRFFIYLIYILIFIPIFFVLCYALTLLLHIEPEITGGIIFSAMGFVYLLIINPITKLWIRSRRPTL